MANGQAPEPATQELAAVPVQPCCGPECVGGPGKPFTPHYLATHDKDGRLNLPGTAKRLPTLDLSSAAWLAAMHQEGGKPLLCSHQTGVWYAWDGSVYAPQEALFASRLAQHFAWDHDRLLSDIERAVKIAARGDEKQEKAGLDRWKAHRAYRDKIWSEHGQAALIRQIGRTCGEDEKLLDTGTGEIIVDNGRISYAQILRDGRVELLPHDPESLVTKRMGAGVRYEPGADCPVFKAFLRTSVADMDQRRWLLWRTASARLGLMPRKGFVNLIGEHDSGKTTYVEIMAALGGAYVTTVKIKTFMAKGSNDSGFLEADLRGARMVCAHEPRPDGRYDNGYIKTITSR